MRLRPPRSGARGRVRQGPRPSDLASPRSARACRRAGVVALVVASVVALTVLVTKAAAINPPQSAGRAGPPALLPASATPWAEWTAFSARFITPDGRVVDRTVDQKSTSEGQAYGLFFALANNQRAQFDLLLHWTIEHLAQGDLQHHLPSWWWGQAGDGTWGVRDQNAAADADLWLAYDLLEAGRLWQVPGYTAQGRAVLALVQATETRAHATRTGSGQVLLPAPYGFELGEGRVRLVSSYQPDFMLAYLANVDSRGPWQAIRTTFATYSLQAFAHGVAPDLFQVTAQGMVQPDGTPISVGSYDAIRVYLWAGLSAAAPGTDHAALERLRPFAELVRAQGAPPEKTDAMSGRALPSAYTPPGFRAAMLPFLGALDEPGLLQQQALALRALQANTGDATLPQYYDAVLALFGRGWLEGRYRFDAQGALQPWWAGAR